jgi:hypothetical protein
LAFAAKNRKVELRRINREIGGNGGADKRTNRVMRRLFSKMMGQSHLAGRVASLQDRASKLVLPRCERCGFGTMRVFHANPDMYDDVLEPGQTRMRCDRPDCGCVVTVVSREAVRA